MITEQKITDEELLSLAVVFDLGPELIVNGTAFWYETYPKEIHRHHVLVRWLRLRPRGTWVISNEFDDWLTKDGTWEKQCITSQSELIARYQYQSVHEAINYYRRWHASLTKWLLERLAIIEEIQPIVNYEDCPVELLKF